MKKILAIVIFTITVFTGCSRVDELDDKSFVTAIGIDKGENYALRFTFIFTSPSNGNDASNKEKQDETIVIEAPSLYSAMEQIDNFKSKRIVLTHTQTIVFSSELAKEGLEDHIYMLIRSNHFRPNTYVCIADKSSMKFLEKINPVQTYHLEKYFQLIFRKMSSGTKSDLYLYHAYFSLLSESRAGVFPYCSVNNITLKPFEEEMKESPSESQSESPSEGETSEIKFPDDTDDFNIDTVAGSSVAKSENRAEIQGAVVVKKGVYVSLLGRNETMILRMITNNMPNNYITLSDPNNPDKMITCYVTPLNKTKIKVNCDDNPKISINIKLEGDFAEMGKDDYVLKNPEVFEKYFEDKAKAYILNFLEKIKNMNCDVCQFSEVAKMQFLTAKQWQNYKWDEKFPLAEFDVDIDLTVKTYGELS